MSKDVHPEDLLARAASGTLSEKERLTLERHLSDCAGCRIHRMLEKDADLPLPAGNEGLLIRAENAALARYGRSRALADRAPSRRKERLIRSDGSVPSLDLRTQGGKPPH